MRYDRCWPISAGRGQRGWLMRPSDLGYDTLLMAQRAILRTALPEINKSESLDAHFYTVPDR
jgi:hypothetical protein